MPSFGYLFPDRQRSYNMILILSMLNLLASPSEKLSMNAVVQEFKRLLAEQGNSGVV